MMPGAAYPLSGAVEGLVDEAVLRRIASDLGIPLGAVHGKKGKDFLRAKISAYNNAARHGPWAVLVDLDDEFECAPILAREWLPTPAQWMCLRVAVRAVESWLLADRKGLARFISVPHHRLPAAPDHLADPKQTMVDLARASRRAEIRQDLVPRPGSGRRVGPGYTLSVDRVRAEALASPCRREQLRESPALSCCTGDSPAAGSGWLKPAVP